MDKFYIPNKNETAVISDRPKTAALFYDRVWSPSTFIMKNNDGLIPREASFFGITELTEFDYLKKQLMSSGLYLNGPEGDKDMNLHLSMLQFGTMTNVETFKGIGYFFRNNLARSIANEFTRTHDISVSTYFSDSKTQALSYKEGEKEVIIASIDDLDIVDESQLSWEQVLELRNDKESKAKYKRFIHWLDKEMVGKSQSYIEDDIAIKLEDYEQALRKHGIKTILGTVKEIINSKSFLAGAGLGSLGFSLSNPLTAFVGGSIMVSNIAVSLAEKKLAFEECETGANSEISWVHEVKKKTKKE